MSYPLCEYEGRMKTEDRGLRMEDSRSKAEDALRDGDSTGRAARFGSVSPLRGRLRASGERVSAGQCLTGCLWHCNDLEAEIRINPPLSVHVRFFFEGVKNLRFTRLN